MVKIVRSLLSTITDKASASFGEVTKNNYNEWREHWIKIGKEWAEELKAEGLIKTYEAVMAHVEYEEKNG